MPAHAYSFPQTRGDAIMLAFRGRGLRRSACAGVGDEGDRSHNDGRARGEEERGAAKICGLDLAPATAGPVEREIGKYLLPNSVHA
jgi:hypothetical protein